MNLGTKAIEFYRSLPQSERHELKSKLMSQLMAHGATTKSPRTVQAYLNGGNIPGHLYNVVANSVRRAMFQKQKKLLLKQRSILDSLEMLLKEQEFINLLIHN